MTRKQISLVAVAVIVFIIIAAAAVFLIARPQADPFAADAITDPAFPSLTYGVQAFLWWDGGEVGFNLDWITMMGFSHVKQSFAWRDLEPQPGEWRFEESADRIVNEIEQRGLKLVARLGNVPEWAASEANVTLESSDKTDLIPADDAVWAAYCGRVAERYAGRIAAYQIWNEPNLSREWGGNEPDAAGYVGLLAACSEAIRAADPAAKIISAGLAPTGNHDALAHRDDLYLQAMYEAGFQQYVDAVGVHAPGFDAPHVGPDDAEAKGNQRWMSFRRVEDLRKIMIANGDAARQMAILEVGYTTDPLNPAYSWFAVSEEEQADRLRDAYLYAAEHWRPWVGLMSTIYIAKPTWTEQDEEYWWALTEPHLADGYIAIREALFELARMPKYCGDQVNAAIPPEEEISFATRNTCN